MSSPSRSGLFALLVASLLAGCAQLPPRPVDPPPTPAVDSGMTRLSQKIEPGVAAHPGLTGIWPLSNPRDAFASRVLLANAADRTLDVQYYIWHRDLTGTLLLRALRDAADRGVRVRLLLDDNGTAGMDGEMKMLDDHPNIEVRLFNPFVIRAPKWIGYVTDFSRANRRMHSKSFTADGQAAIVGGRNVGDEYFGATDDVLFADLDVLAVGPAVRDVSAQFERFWTSASAYPVASILPPVDAAQREALRAEDDATVHDTKAQTYVEALRESKSIQVLLQGDLKFDWAATRMVSDDPAKGLGGGREDELLINQLREILGAPEHDVELVSPYFVPTQAGVDAFTGMAQRGVRVRVLTNALESTDVAAVHAGYSKRRKALLRGGVALYEMRRTATPDKGGADKGPGPLGSSGSSLHAKTFSVDGTHVFVGSFNFDPRSTRLNTELGFVIDSPALAASVQSVFDNAVTARAYEVHLDPQGRLYWLEQKDGQTVRLDTEPGTSFLKRMGVSILSFLPIDWLL